MPSTGSVGDAHDNAMAESFFATIEREVLNRRRSKTQAEARMAIFEWLEGWYNPHRRHSSLVARLLVAHQLREEATDQRDRNNLGNYPSTEAGQVHLPPLADLLGLTLRHAARLRYSGRYPTAA